MGNWQLVITHQGRSKLIMFCMPFHMIGTVQLSPWMGKLFRPMGPGYRLQIKARASAQKREMTKKSVHKVTQKPQVYFGGKQKRKTNLNPW